MDPNNHFPDLKDAVQINIVKMECPGEFWITVLSENSSFVSATTLIQDNTNRVTRLMLPRSNDPFDNSGVDVGMLVGVSMDNNKIWRPAICIAVNDYINGKEMLLLDSGQTVKLKGSSYRLIPPNFKLEARFKLLVMYNALPCKSKSGNNWNEAAYRLTRVYEKLSKEIFAVPVFRKKWRGTEKIFAHIYFKLHNGTVVNLQEDLLSKGFCLGDEKKFQMYHGLEVQELAQSLEETKISDQEYSASMASHQCPKVPVERSGKTDTKSWIEARELEEKNIGFRLPNRETKGKTDTKSWIEAREQEEKNICFRLPNRDSKAVPSSSTRNECSDIFQQEVKKLTNYSVDKANEPYATGHGIGTNLEFHHETDELGASSSSYTSKVEHTFHPRSRHTRDTLWGRTNELLSICSQSNTNTSRDSELEEEENEPEEEENEREEVENEPEEEEYEPAEEENEPEEENEEEERPSGNPVNTKPDLSPEELNRLALEFFSRRKMKGKI